jgi:hypothetical protein
MNIIQLFDQLNIQKNHVATFSDSDIIRIEKELNVERKINPEIDVNVANNLVSILKNDKESLLFVLNSRPLYNLFSGKVLPKSDFVLNQNTVDENEIKSFIENYLSDDLTLFFDKEIASNKFGDIADLLAIKRYFTEDVLFRIEKKIHGKVDFAVAKLSQMPLNLIDIEYIKNNHFYRLLNVFVSLETDDKIRDLINPIVEKYNNNYSKEFLSGSMIAMFNYYAFDEDLRKVIVDNKAAMFTNLSRDSKNSTSDSGNVGSKKSWWGVGVAFFIIIKILLLMSKCDNKDTSNNQNFYNQEIQENETFDPYKQQMSYDKSVAFFAFLTQFDANKVSNKTISSTAKTGDCPFSSVYYQLPSNFSKKEKINFQNNSHYDVIVLMNLKTKISGDFANRSFKTTKNAFLVKSKEQFRIDNDTTNGLSYSFYFGKKLVSFETNEQSQYKTKDSITDFRFLNLARNADKLIEQELIFTSDVEIFDKNGEISWKQKI